MNRRALVTSLVIVGLAVGIIGWLAGTRQAESDTYADMPDVIYFYGPTVPSSSSYALGMAYTCIARPYPMFGPDDQPGDWLFSAFCYAGSNNPPFPPYAPDPEDRFSLVTLRGRESFVAPIAPDGNVTLHGPDCFPFETRLDIAFVLDLDSPGYGPSAIEVREDVPSGDCSGPPAATLPLWYLPKDQTADYDGDGCSDYYELSPRLDFFDGAYSTPFVPVTPIPSVTPTIQGSDNPYGVSDPFNPGDCGPDIFATAGVYTIWGFPDPATKLDGGGFYYYCITDINWVADTNIIARPYCYMDGNIDVNPEGYSGVTGDGLPGGGPPWFAIPAVETPEANCDRFGLSLDEDSDGTVNDGCPEEGFGDVNYPHDELTGSYNTSTYEIILTGCLRDMSTLGNIYVLWTLDARSGSGWMKHWYLDDCSDPPPGGDPSAQGPLTIMAGEVGEPARGREGRDSDDDGCPDARELGDDAGVGGLRDPFNPYDWYDVNQDGVIDLFTDILGVISHYSLDGGPPYKVNYDRGLPIDGGVGGWNRKGPDGIIDLFTDILGVISQYSLTGC